MAMCDYYLCDHCGNKAFYDALIAQFDDDGHYLLSGAKVDIAALCERCATTHTCIVVPRDARTAWAEDFDQRLQAKLTPTLNSGTAMELLVVVGEVLREMQAKVDQ